jgi:beta-glucanase (GH16 family)
MPSPAHRIRFMRLLVITMFVALGWQVEAADDPTIYQIRNRWLSDQVLADRDGKVVYQKGGEKGDAKTQWTMSEAHGRQRLQNVGTHAYMVVMAGATDVTTSAKADDVEAGGEWDVAVGESPWCSIKNVASGRFVNCERKLGHLECDSTKAPGGDNFWSGQWELVHVAGPAPKRRFRNHEIAVVSPAYCADVTGDVRVEIVAPGFKRVTAKCWKQGDGFGADSTVAADVGVDENGGGSFVFPAEQYPHGPITLRISAEDGAAKDNCYLQLYNTGGVSWNEGMPREAPAAAKGMTLMFADDFAAPLSISTKDASATYFDHKPLGGDFSTLTFTGHDDGAKNPFLQIGTYLRIRADATKKSAGLISSLRNDGNGIKATAPCYFECRFIGPNAIGSWPAFWLMTDYPTRRTERHEKDGPSDELDVIEAYGGEGAHHPNAGDKYMITPHAWGQGAAGKAAEAKAFKAVHSPISMRKFGIPSTWFESPHTYGCLVTRTDTVYFCDNIEVGRHGSLELSKTEPLFFMINLATGGGWPVDLSRYDGRVDMYVDFVRVYQQGKQP